MGMKTLQPWHMIVCGASYITQMCTSRCKYVKKALGLMRISDIGRTSVKDSTPTPDLPMTKSKIAQPHLVRLVKNFDHWTIKLHLGLPMATTETAQPRLVCLCKYVNIGNNICSTSEQTSTIGFDFPMAKSENGAVAPELSL